MKVKLLTTARPPKAITMQRLLLPHMLKPPTLASSTHTDLTLDTTMLRTVRTCSRWRSLVRMVGTLWGLMDSTTTSRTPMQHTEGMVPTTLQAPLTAMEPQLRTNLCSSRYSQHVNTPSLTHVHVHVHVWACFGPLVSVTYMCICIIVVPPLPSSCVFLLFVPLLPYLYLSLLLPSFVNYCSSSPPLPHLYILCSIPLSSQNYPTQPVATTATAISTDATEAAKKEKVNVRAPVS